MIQTILNNYSIDLIYDENNQFSKQSFSPAILELVSGIEYIVTFNEITYSLIAQEKINDTRKIIFIGNEFLDQDENKPAFLIQYIYDSLTEEYTTEIYCNNKDLINIVISVAVDTDKIDIIFYNKRGKPVIYSDIDTISMDTVVSGTQATFFRGTVVPPFEEALNMKEGNQIIDANGAFFESVSIIKPETLIPENIKKGIDIGGVEGTFEIKGESKTAEIDFSTPYFKAYSSSDVNAFAIEENIGKYIRIMYKPYDGLFNDKK